MLSFKDFTLDNDTFIFISLLSDLDMYVHGWITLEV